LPLQFDFDFDFTSSSSSVVSEGHHRFCTMAGGGEEIRRRGDGDGPDDSYSMMVNSSLGVPFEFGGWDDSAFVQQHQHQRQQQHQQQHQHQHQQQHQQHQHQHQQQQRSARVQGLKRSWDLIHK